MRFGILRAWIAVASALILLAPPAPANEPAEGAGRIVGRAVGQDGKTPLVGVVLVAYHLRHDRTFRSAPSDPKGGFSLEGLPFGYYEVAVETPDGLFVGNAVVNVPPSGKAILELVLAPFGPQDDPERSFLGESGADGTGVARVDEKLTRKEFWKSPRGLAIVGGVGGAALLLFAASDSPNEPPASPVQPADPPIGP